METINQQQTAEQPTEQSKPNKLFYLGIGLLAIGGIAYLFNRNKSNAVLPVDSAENNVNVKPYKPKYFKIKEVTKNKQVNIVTQNNILLLIKHVLDPLRKAFGSPILISKGYTPHWLNMPHLPIITQTKKGLANGLGVEIRPQKGGHKALKRIIQIAKQQGNFDVITLENNSIYIAYNPNGGKQRIYKYSSNTYLNVTNDWQKFI